MGKWGGGGGMTVVLNNLQHPTLGNVLQGAYELGSLDP